MDAQNAVRSNRACWGYSLENDRVADLPTVYISGDNASLSRVEEIAERLGPIDIAVLFAGAARTALVPGENLTLSSADAARAVAILGNPKTLMLHFEDWAHFTEGRPELLAAIEAANLSQTLTMATRGSTVRL